MPDSATSKAAILDDLRARVRRLEGLGGGDQRLPLGVAAIDAALPDGGLPLGCVHEMVPATGDDATAAMGFAAIVLARLAAARGTVIWVTPRRELYGPGLAGLGLTPDRLMVVRTRRDSDALWAIEEALRCRGLGGVLGEVGTLALPAGRRLQLAAESGQVTALLLRPGPVKAAAGAATSRWSIAARPSLLSAGQPGVGAICWRVELVRCRGGRPGGWDLSVDGTGRLVESELDRRAEPAAASARRA